MELLCEKCRWYQFDGESDEGFCAAVLDEDEYRQAQAGISSGRCRFFCPDSDDYQIVRRQN